MLKIKVVLICFFVCDLVCATTPSLSDPYPIFTIYQDDFPPYALGTNPSVCKIQRIYAKEKRGLTFQSYSYIDNGDRYQIILDSGKTRNMRKGGFWITKLTVLRNNKLMVKDVVVDLERPYSAVVFLSYLNQDNKKDIIIAVPTVSSGPSTYFITFLLSDGDHYHVRRIYTYGISQNLFYDYNDDGKCEFLQLNAFDGTLISKEGPPYLVYNIVQFTKSSFRYNNKLSRFFPRWIAYRTTSPGHIPNTHATKFPERITNLFWRPFLKNIEKINSGSYGYYGLKLDLDPVKKQLTN